MHAFVQLKPAKPFAGLFLRIPTAGLKRQAVRAYHSETQPKNPARHEVNLVNV